MKYVEGITYIALMKWFTYLLVQYMQSELIENVFKTVLKLA